MSHIKSEPKGDKYMSDNVFYLSEISHELDDPTLNSFSQVATGIRDMKGMLLDRIKELEDALSDLIKFAEECDMQIESEWGSYCGSLSDMYDRGLVSEEILAARAALNKGQK